MATRQARESEPEWGFDERGRIAPGVRLSGRVIADYSTGTPGPLFLVLGGMHGNEPAGVLAAHKVLEHLRAKGVPFRGRFVALAGNMEALRRGVRFIDRDLNRLWSWESVGGIASFEDRDAREGRELLEAIEGAIRSENERVIAVDCHSTSAEGSPFTLIGDTLANRKIASCLPIPVILGLEERVEGALLEYFNDRGHVALGIEGGEHADPATITNLAACIWVTLVAGGCVERSDVPWVEGQFELLRAAARGLPGVVEIRHRHGVREGDGFRMREGFDNFRAVSKGEVLATDEEGDILAPEDGVVLLPLYQGKGEDGFFVGREVRRFWLRISTIARSVRLDVLLRLLPGVEKSPYRPNSFLADPRVARLWLVEIFHLLGYRRCRPVKGRLQFTRRVERPRTR